MVPNQTTEQKLTAAKRDAFRVAAEWIPGIKIIQRRNPAENLFICNQGKERYGLSDGFFQHLPSYEFRRLVFDPESPDTCLFGPPDATDTEEPGK